MFEKCDGLRFTEVIAFLFLQIFLEIAILAVLEEHVQVIRCARDIIEFYNILFIEKRSVRRKKL